MKLVKLWSPRESGAALVKGARATLVEIVVNMDNIVKAEPVLPPAGCTEKDGRWMCLSCVFGPRLFVRGTVEDLTELATYGPRPAPRPDQPCWCGGMPRVPGPDQPEPVSAVR